MAINLPVYLSFLLVYHTVCLISVYKSAMVLYRNYDIQHVDVNYKNCFHLSFLLPKKENLKKKEIENVYSVNCR